MNDSTPPSVDRPRRPSRIPRAHNHALPQRAPSRPWAPQRHNPPTVAITWRAVSLARRLAHSRRGDRFPLGQEPSAPGRRPHRREPFPQPDQRGQHRVRQVDSLPGEETVVHLRVSRQALDLNQCISQPDCARQLMYEGVLLAATSPRCTAPVERSSTPGPDSSGTDLQPASCATRNHVGTLMPSSWPGAADSEIRCPPVWELRL